MTENLGNCFIHHLRTFLATLFLVFIRHGCGLGSSRICNLVGGKHSNKKGCHNPYYNSSNFTRINTVTTTICGAIPLDFAGFEVVASSSGCGRYGRRIATATWEKKSFQGDD